MWQRGDRQQTEQKLKEWFKDAWSARCVALTLTFRPRTRGAVDPIEAQETLRHFMRRLNRRVYGKAATRHGVQLPVLPVLEGGGDKRLHYHLTIPVPDGHEAAAFGALCIRVWRTLQAAGEQNDHRLCTVDGRWRDYQLKQRDKPDYQSAVDFINLVR